MRITNFFIQKKTNLGDYNLGDYGLSCKAQSQKREKKLAEPRFSLFLSLQYCIYLYRKQPKIKISYFKSIFFKKIKKKRLF
ncbi:MAG: hypothetical protein EAY69_03550 [Cytophagales bacterium]|nr:MAG: hypothetical protein EAY69_03550 [Cytophagales bacterium]